MNRTLRKLVTAGAIGLASLLPMQKAEAQGNISGFVEVSQSEKDKASFIRPNLFYDVLGLNAYYTFTEFLKHFCIHFILIWFINP